MQFLWGLMGFNGDLSSYKPFFDSSEWDVSPSWSYFIQMAMPLLACWRNQKKSGHTRASAQIRPRVLDLLQFFACSPTS